MKLGKIKYLIIIFLLSISNLKSDEKISSVPLVNLDNLKPSFESVETNEITTNNNEIINIKKRKLKNNESSSIFVNLLGLDKITAKTTSVKIKLGETKKFGLLQIKAIQCGKIDSINEPGEAAYIQVKDISDNNNEKIFVFNGWTFSSNPSLRPMDHPVYDLWLVSCENV
ncbi:DUF2155 domain-containing protein [Pelagibacteraceae bacterium]|jgi:hypothetical protein|nr:DUF2155 domain-containing protein [Pelagibacteraceae bacterium]